MPCTKLGRLVRDGKIKSLEQMYLFSLPIKEFQITDFFMGDKLKDEVMQIKPVQKQTSAGQRTRFVCYVAVGDYDGHIGLGEHQHERHKRTMVEAAPGVGLDRNLGRCQELDDALCTCAVVGSGGEGETRLPFAVDDAMLDGAPNELWLSSI